MAVSLFGIIWIALCVFGLFKKTDFLICLLLISMVFQASYVIVISGNDLQASLITTAFVIVKCAATNRGISLTKWQKKGLLFGFCALFISTITPIIFNGMQIVNITNDEYNYGLSHIETVSLSVRNFTMGITILMYLITSILILNSKHSIDFARLIVILRNIFLFVFFIGLLHECLILLGLPTDWYQALFHNEKEIYFSTFVEQYEYGRFTKFNSTFWEASVCGAYLATMLIIFIFSHFKHKKITIVLCVLAIILNVSSTGYFATAFVLLFWIIKSMKSYRTATKATIVFGFIVVAFFSSYFLSNTVSEIVNTYLFEKSHSGSFDLRVTIDIIALKVFIRSYGLGVGLNSVQTYSLISGLLAQLGVIGFVTFVSFIHALYKATDLMSQNKKELIIGSLSVILFAQTLSIQALNFQVFWLIVFVVSILSGKQVKLNEVCVDKFG